jgi:hypothetical protein
MPVARKQPARHTVEDLLAIPEPQRCKPNARHLLPLGLLLAGCSQLERLEGADERSGVPAPVQAVLTQYCAVPGCHMGTYSPDFSVGGGGAFLDLAATSGKPYVSFGDPRNSEIALRLLGEGSAMPPATHPQPTPEELALVLGWLAGVEFPEGESTSDAAPMTGTGSGSDGTGDPPKLCSLADVQPSADPSSAIVAGDGPDDIPTVVGDTLLRNCGCHYTETTVTGYSPYVGMQSLSTLADFHADFVGVIPSMSNDMPTYLAVQARVVEESTNPMPQVICDADGTPATQNEHITQEDFDLLADWLAAGAPAGADYP